MGEADQTLHKEINKSWRDTGSTIIQSVQSVHICSTTENGQNCTVKSYVRLNQFNWVTKTNQKNIIKHQNT